MATFPQPDNAYAAIDGDEALRQAAALAQTAPSVPQTDPNQIPLVCYSCEKQQRFSDLSHLLTHVSSKAHLLELYNLEVLSQVDNAAATRCRQFDTWYNTYNMVDTAAEYGDTNTQHEMSEEIIVQGFHGLSKYER